MTPYERAGRQSAHNKLAAPMNQEEATALEDLSGLHGDPGPNPFFSQLGGKTLRYGLAGLGAGVLGGGLGGALGANPGDRLGGALRGARDGAVFGGSLGVASGLSSGAIAGTQNMARAEGLKGQNTALPELAGMGTGALTGGLFGGYLGHTLGRSPAGTAIGASLGGALGGAAGIANAGTMRQLGAFRAHTKREAPLDDLTRLMAF